MRTILSCIVLSLLGLSIGCFGEKTTVNPPAPTEIEAPVITES